MVLPVFHTTQGSGGVSETACPGQTNGRTDGNPQLDGLRCGWTSTWTHPVNHQHVGATGGAGS